MHQLWCYHTVLELIITSYKYLSLLCSVAMSILASRSRPLFLHTVSYLKACGPQEKC